MGVDNSIAPPPRRENGNFALTGVGSWASAECPYHGFRAISLFRVFFNFVNFLSHFFFDQA